MYQDFFGFKLMPFNITPDPSFLFLSPTHQEALAHLRYGIQERKGFIMLTGEVGCGKTTICRTLLNELNPNQFETALILNPKLSSTQLLKEILRELHEPLPLSNEDLIHSIQSSLIKKINQNKDIILIIDEAQNLSFDALETIRLLSNLETHSQKLLQILLIGQPELHQKIKSPQLRQLKQRILVQYNLSHFSFKDTQSYINHRLSLAQGSGRPFFTYWALRKIQSYSNGIPRIINNLCDKSLLSAFIRMTNKVSYFDVKKAIKDIHY